MHITSWFGAIIIVLSIMAKRSMQSCDIYKLGKFYIYNKDSKQRIDIERKDSLQIETNRESGDITVMKVN